MDNSAGFTLIEVLVVLGLLATLFGGISATLSINQTQYNHFKNTQVLQQYLHQAQQYSLLGKDNQSWGVCILDNQISLFFDNCSSENIYQASPISSNTSITGLNNMTFDNSGETTQTATITTQTGNFSSSFSINQLGALSE